MRVSLEIAGDIKGRREIPLEGPGEYLVGRGAEAAVEIHDTLASKRHCLLILDERGLRVRDLHSTNGTRVDGVVVGGRGGARPEGEEEDTARARRPDAADTIARPVEAVVRDGSVVEVGSTRIVVSFGTGREADQEKLDAWLDDAEALLAQAATLVRKVLARDPSNTRANLLHGMVGGLGETIDRERP